MKYAVTCCARTIAIMAIQIATCAGMKSKHSIDRSEVIERNTIQRKGTKENAEDATNSGIQADLISLSLEHHVVHLH
eukprot:4489092-Amphidinium_carterae.1